MRYLVTGGAGFIGSHLCEALVAQGHDVWVLDDFSTGKRENLAHLPQVNVQVGSITDAELVARMVAQVDGVFHLAAIASVELSRVQWEHTHQVNSTGTVTLLSAISRLEKKIPFVYASSAAVYGDNPALPLTESETPRPLTAYGADKLGNEHHAKVAAQVHGMRSFGLRFFNVFGPRQDPSSPYSGVISIFARRIAQGQGITIYGDGKQTRDFIYVGDVVRALRAAMAHLEASAQPLARVCNACTGTATDLLELAATLGRLCGRTPQISFAAVRLGDIRDSLGSKDLLNKVLSVQAQVSLEEGLRALIDAEAVV